MSETGTATLAETLAQVGAVLEGYPDARGTLMLHFRSDGEMSKAASALGFAGIAERVVAEKPFYLAAVPAGRLDVLCMGPTS